MERRLRTGAKADKPKVTSRQADYRFFRNAATFPILNARHALPWPRASLAPDWRAWPAALMTKYAQARGDKTRARPRA